MQIPSFRILYEHHDEVKTLADIPEWTFAECNPYGDVLGKLRFRVGDFAYSTCINYPPQKQARAEEYRVKRIIGKIICE